LELRHPKQSAEGSRYVNNVSGRLS